MNDNIQNENSISLICQTEYFVDKWVASQYIYTPEGGSDITMEM